MRITGGIYRGRIVECPPGVIRPAMDRMRESVFAVLGDLSGVSFLDLFTGSGVIGIEAASRGASRIVLIEKDPGKRKTIMKNMAFVEADAKLHIMPAERYVRTAGEPFDIIFLDPPFGYAFKDDLLSMIERSKLIKEGTLVLLHYPEEENHPEQVGALELKDSRKYGRSVVLFYEYLIPPVSTDT